MALSDRYPRLKRISSFIVVLAAIAIYFGVVAPSTAQDHAVSLHLQGPTNHLTRLDLLWTAIDAPDAEPVAGATFNFDEGRAPDMVRTTVHVPPGTYWLGLTLHQGDALAKLRRQIILDSAETKVFVTIKAP